MTSNVVSEDMRQASTSGLTFKDMRIRDKLYIDKTLLIKDILPYTIQNHSALEDKGHWMVSPDSKYKSVSVGNKTYDYGLVLMMDMALIGNNMAQTHFNLRGQYETLSFIAGPVNSKDASNGKGWITIKGDGKILHEYEIKQDDIAKRITLDVTGVHQLSVFSEQSEMSLYGAIVDAWVYPAGQAPDVETETAVSETDPRLKTLPDVCKLISNIPPYSTRSDVDRQVYTGESDYITFSMGGTKFSEGFILYEKANFWDDNVVSYAAFDLGNEFDYVSFTAGYVGKSWVMNNDKLMVYADDRLILEAPLNATSPNQKYVLPLNKCRKLRFENGGQGTMNVGAYGIGDLVVYRGEPVENDLFVHPIPECPHNIDLIDLGAPYIHYVSTSQGNVFYDGSTQRKYFTMPDGSRINKGFMLQTSTHFSLDHGVLSGTENTMAATVGAAAVGSSFVVAGAVGGTLIGSTLMGAAAFLVLAAGGEAVENSCAAFNIYGDLAQNITRFRGLTDWDKVAAGEVFTLEQNYRNTNQIVSFVAKELAIDMQPIGFDGPEVAHIGVRGVNAFFRDKKGLKAVIVSEGELETYRRKSYNVLRDTGRLSKTKINLMTVYESKGLEFTCVAVADARMTRQEKYIAYTRALKELAVIGGERRD